MQWAILAKKLQSGETIQFRPSGNSMVPRIKSRQLVTVEPAEVSQIESGDVVLCKVKGNYYLHLVKKIGDDGRVLISNNKGRENGWTRQVFGKLIKVE